MNTKVGVATPVKRELLRGSMPASRHAQVRNVV